MTNTITLAIAAFFALASVASASGPGLAAGNQGAQLTAQIDGLTAQIDGAVATTTGDD